MAVPTLPNMAEHSTDISIIVLRRLQAEAVGLNEEVVSRLARHGCFLETSRVRLQLLLYLFIFGYVALK